MKSRHFTDQDLNSLTEFVKKDILPTAKDRDEKESFPYEAHQQLHQLGWSRCFLPTEFGGMGATSEDLVHVYREIAYGSPGIATSMAANMLAMVPILIAGSKEMRTNIAKEYNEKFSLSSFCFTEPDHGSDVLRIETVAKKTNGGYLLSGKKCFITNANYAERFLVVAKLENGGSPKKAMGLFLINKNAKGLSIGTAYSKLGLRDSNTSEIFLDDVFVPISNLVGEEGQGFAIACRSIQRSRIMLSASAIGLCNRAGDITRKYLLERNLYGKPLLSQATITNQLGQLYAEKEAIWLLIKAAANAWDAGDTSFQLSSTAKLLSGQLAMKFASACTELFGGWGCTKEYEIERIYRDAKFYEIMEGPSFVQLAILSKELFPELQAAKQEGKALT